LARAAGPRRAKEVIATGRPFSAAEALDWGVANRICPSDQLLPAALETAQRIAANAPLAVRAVKRAIDLGDGHGLSSGMAIELEQYGQLFPTEDRREGIRAWREKRKPAFKGR
ncbi:MAG TPA: enoyl-CoA hydratase-related protein, partial [Caulobacteraceae bacterium]